MGHRALKEPLEIRLKRRTRKLRQLHGFLLEELRDRLRAPLATRMAALRHGFSTRHFTLYELDHNAPGDYLPSFADLDYGLGRPQLLALRDKLTFALVMDRLGAPHPRVLAYLDHGRLMPVAEPSVPAHVAGLGDLVGRHAGLVLKPIAGFAGNQVVLLTVDGDGIRANGEPVDQAQLAARFASATGMLVTELAGQGRYAREIAPASANTVRFLTMWDDDRPFIAAAAHRFGLPRTYPIDNFHGGKGGLSAAIDLETGELGPGATLSAEGRLQRFAVHPDSGAPIVGVQVPGWAVVAAEVLRVAAALPHIPYVGWDVVVTDEGPSFLEANTPPGTLVWQVHGGLLRDPRVRRACAALGLG